MMPIKTRLAKEIVLSCLTVSDLEKAKRFFVNILGLRLKDYQEEHRWMKIGGKEGSVLGIGQVLSKNQDVSIQATSNAIPCDNPATFLIFYIAKLLCEFFYVVFKSFSKHFLSSYFSRVYEALLFIHPSPNVQGFFPSKRFKNNVEL